MYPFRIFFFFFFNDTATTEIYTLSLHDALPISSLWSESLDQPQFRFLEGYQQLVGPYRARDRKSTRLNSSHSQISYAVFCLKKKKKKYKYKCYSTRITIHYEGLYESRVHW